MLLKYPDYNKTSPEYILGIIDAFADYPESIQQELANQRTGLLSKHSYVPTIADVYAMGDAMKKREEEAAKIRPQVKVFEDTEAWAAWQIARNGRIPIVDMRDDDGCPRRGWYFPSEFP
jgi:hypothetical protein